MMDLQRLTGQLKVDEGFISVAKWDNKQYSYGYGCRAPGEGATITEPNACILLGKRIDEAIADFQRIFKGHTQKFNDVREEAFINMLFQMGPGRKDCPEVGGLQSFTNTLNCIFRYPQPDWAAVAANLRKSLWYRQTPERAKRICREVETGQKGA